MSHQHTHHDEHEHDHEHPVPMDCDGEGHEHHHHADGSCCCEHHSAEYHGLNKTMVCRLVISLLLFIVGTIMQGGHHHGGDHHNEFGLDSLIMIAAALIAGYDILLSAVRNLFSRRFFDEYFLMTFAAVAACAIGEFQEGAAVMVLYRLGVSCQSYAIRHSRRKLYCLTGEDHSHDDALDGKTEHFITSFSRVYTPVVLVLAVLLCVLLPLLTELSFSESMYRALSFLVLACPCAIVISVPLAYFAGIGCASRKGIFFTDASSVDKLAKDKAWAEHFVKQTLYGGECLVYVAGAKRYDAIVRVREGATAAQAAKIAAHTRTIAIQNILFVVVIKAAVLVLSAFGVSALWFSVFADSGVTVLAVLNSLRAFYSK